MAEIPKGAIALYRICTEKSKLGFGKYEDYFVGDILKINPQYISWVYYNYEKVSFHARILELLGLEVIPKPGTAPEKHKDYLRRASQAFTQEQRRNGHYKFVCVEKKRAKAKLCRVEREVNLSKAELQAINHGKL